MQENTINTNNLPTLAEVELFFQDWRSTRKNAREPIPEPLWTLVSSLIGRYQQSEICQRLGLTNQQLSNRHLKSARQSEATTPPNPLPAVPKSLLDSVVVEESNSDTFIKISLPTSTPAYPLESGGNQQNLAKSTTHDVHSQIELTHPNGMVLRITSMADHQMSNLLSSFMGMAH